MARTVATIDRLLADRHLLKHPFYVAWSRGELPLSTLRSYAGQYYHFESNFPRYVAAAYAQLTRAEDRRLLLENLVDEEGRQPTHPELWLDFAQGIGLPRGAARRATASDATRSLLRRYETEGARGPGPALAALYAYESIFPEVAAEKSRGLRAHYGIRDRATHEFFRVHTGADVEHSRAERGLIASELKRSPAIAEATYGAARRTIDAWWSFLDAFPMPTAARSGVA
ncbi:MAG TPA: CADD family putative folate metabolism protein [Thermoplasmata archaeon]|nr:CADD family putative folate metabolism protein [Thermoplasmata archaeon]